MKKDKAVPNASGKNSNPENKFSGNDGKKRKPGVVNSNTITSATAKSKARSGGSLNDEGTMVSYDEER